MPTTDATEGTELVVPVLNRATVGPKCNITEPNSGHWFCITHDEGFQHNMAMQSHTSRGDHVLAWICHTHGPEAP